MGIALKLDLFSLVFLDFSPVMGIAPKKRPVRHAYQDFSPVMGIALILKANRSSMILNFSPVMGIALSKAGYAKTG